MLAINFDNEDLRFLHGQDILQSELSVPASFMKRFWLCFVHSEVTLLQSCLEFYFRTRSFAAMSFITIEAMHISANDVRFM